MEEILHLLSPIRNLKIKIPMRLPAIIVVLMLAGCAGRMQHWYNPGETQVDFDRDAQECDIIAREFARQATLTGNRQDPETYVRTYNNCLYAKGWSVLPPGSDSPAGGPPPAAFEKNGTVKGFGEAFTVPTGFVLKSNVTRTYGPTLMQNLFFQGPEQSYINFTFQKGLTRDFAPADFPAREPFFLYEQGALRKDPDRLRWTIFFGNLKNSWVAGLGGYLLLDDRQRVLIVVTKPLPPRNEKPLPGLRLDSGQIKAMEKFRAAWLPWLKSTAGPR
jgi:hypothetical protein